MEKEFLSQKGIAYIEKNVVDDPEAMEELTALGVMTTPVTVIGGKTRDVVVGFDRKKLETLLGP